MKELMRHMVMAMLAFPTALAAEDFKITILRQYKGTDCTSGYLLVGDKVKMHALELPWQNNAPFISSIPAGTYGGTLRYDHADHWRIELNVPNRPLVQIHVGNTPANTQGCILVGEELVDKNLCAIKGGTSKPAYEKLRTEFYGSANPVATPNKTISVTIKD